MFWTLILILDEILHLRYVGRCFFQSFFREDQLEFSEKKTVSLETLASDATPPRKPWKEQSFGRCISYPENLVSIVNTLGLEDSTIPPPAPHLACQSLAGDFHIFHFYKGIQRKTFTKRQSGRSIRRFNSTIFSRNTKSRNQKLLHTFEENIRFLCIQNPSNHI